MAADVAHAQGLTAWRVGGETIRATLARMGLSWRRAKHWNTSPDSEYARKKDPEGTPRDRLIRLADSHQDWLVYQCFKMHDWDEDASLLAASSARMFLGPWRSKSF